MKPKQKPKIPRPPMPLSKAGKAYWNAVLAEFELESHHLDLLCSACLQLDRAASAAEKIAADGTTTKDRFGQIKSHPAVEIERQAHLAFCRLARELGLDVSPPESRGPARPGTRR